MTNWEILGETPDGEFTISPEVRRQHLYVLGRTGTGKSTMLARLALSDIARGDGLLVLDPHGDLAEEIVAHCPSEHLERVFYLDPSDRLYPVPLNLFECRREEDADTACAQVIGVFKQLYGTMWGPLLEDLLRSLTLAMLDHQRLGDLSIPDEAHNATLKDAHDFLLSKSMRNRYYSAGIIGNDMVRRFWVDFYDKIGITKKNEEVNWRQVQYASSTLNKLRRFLLNPLVFDIFCNPNRVSPLDFREIIDKRKVLIVNLSKGKLGEENTALIGSVILSQLAVAALSRANMARDARRAATFHVIADEFQAFATPSFQVLLAEARKYGITVTIAHQYRTQLENEARGATLNCGSMICFRVVGTDADDLALEFDSTPDEFGSRYERVMIARPASGLSQEARFASNERTAYRRVPDSLSFAETGRAIANALTQLPNYTAMTRLADGTSAAANMNALPALDNDELNDRLQVLRDRRRAVAIPKDERRSVVEAHWVSQTREQEAREVVYNAELQDQGVEDSGEDDSHAGNDLPQSNDDA